MSPLPLFASTRLDAPIVVHRGRRVTAQQFSAAVLSLLTRWPKGSYAVNLCENRYTFLLGFVAACLVEQITLLPPNRAAATLRALQSQFPECHVLDDAQLERLLSLTAESSLTTLPEWSIDADRIVALTFTSGSTGAPTEHRKSWRLLTRNAQLAASEVLGGEGSEIVATVPAQHAYGLETSAISALSANCPVFDGKPFFPEDVRQALLALNAPRTLVTTPTHLRVLVESTVELPRLQRVVSATAALPVELARRIESAWDAPVHEIYGCTEAGIMATRRTTETTLWRTFSGGTIELFGETPCYRAPQLDEAVPLQDVVESISPTQFYLHGRREDLVKVAGKRASLQALTRELLSIDGVHDGVVFVPKADARPAALVVAPGKTGNDILRLLQERIDPVFLPRPLLIVAALPRNEVGKLPQSVLLNMLQKHRIQ